MRRTHIYKECKNEECQSKKDKSLGNYWGDPEHSIFVQDGREYSKCSVCLDVAPFRDPDYINTRYPLYNGSVDKVFMDKGQEKAYVKKHKLDAL